LPSSLPEADPPQSSLGNQTPLEARPARWTRTADPTTNLKPADSRYEQQTQGRQVAQDSCLAEPGHELSNLGPFPRLLVARVRAQSASDLGKCRCGCGVKQTRA